MRPFRGKGTAERGSGAERTCAVPYPPIWRRRNRGTSWDVGGTLARIPARRGTESPPGPRPGGLAAGRHSGERPELTGYAPAQEPKTRSFSQVRLEGWGAPVARGVLIFALGT